VQRDWAGSHNADNLETIQSALHYFEKGAVDKHLSVKNDIFLTKTSVSSGSHEQGLFARSVYQNLFSYILPHLSDNSNRRI
jgi:hypothetical protein